MKFNELAKSRYSCRKFSDKKVEKEKIEYILKAAQLSPTAVNAQPQKIYVLQSSDALDKVDECTRYGFGASVNFLVCYDKNASWKRGYDGEEFGPVDASIVITHMMLAAAEQGLGTTWVGSFDPAKVCELFSLPENIIPVSFLPTGYPADDACPAPFHDKRKDISETVVFI